MLYPELRTLAQSTIDDTSTASGIGSATWLAFLNAANRDVWRMLIEINPSFFMTYGDITWPASTERVQLSSSSYLNVRPYKLVGIDVTPSAGNPGPNNPARKLRAIQFAERHDLSRLAGGRAYDLGPGPVAYSYEGSGYLYLAPILDSSAYLRVFYVAPLADMTGSGSDEPLAGLAHEFHDAVAYRAAVLANAKRGGTAPLADMLWQESKDRIDRCAGSRQTDEPWFIKRTARR